MHLLQIFYNPGLTFEQLRGKKWGWLLPTIVLIVQGVLTVSIMLSKFPVIDIIEASAQQRGQDMPPGAAEQAATFMGPVMYAMPAIGTPLMILVIAVVLLGIVKAMSGNTTFPGMMSATAWSMWPWSLISSVLMLLMILTAPDAATANLQNPIPLNLGYFFGQESVGAAFAAILAGIDLLSFYLIYMLSLGASKLSERVSMGSVAVPLLVLYGVWTLGKAGLAAIFG